jgi:taurine--2-oxoglutarate transaminase
MNDRPYYYTWSHQPTADLFTIERAEHDEFVLPNGRRIYDFVSTSFQTNFGHSHPSIREAIHRQLDQMPIASPKAAFELKQQVASRLNQLIGLPGGKVFFTVSGSEAVENALKMARQITGRTKIAARSKSYHGATLGALSVTGDWRNDSHFTLDDHTIRIPEPDDDPFATETRQIIAKEGAERVAALIVETISGTNGVAIPTQSWFDGIVTICRDYDILLIIDEVLCGFGRTNRAFAFQDYGLQPDFVCTSKGISGGYIPFGAVWTGPTIVDHYDSAKMACGLTGYGHPLGLAATGAVLDILADGEFQANKSALELQFAKSLQDIASLESVTDVRCRGLLAAIDLDRPAPPWEAMIQRGLHACSIQNSIIVAPPLVSEPHRLKAATDVIVEILQESLVDR